MTEEGVGTHYTWATKNAGIPFEGFVVCTEYIPSAIDLGPATAATVA